MINHVRTLLLNKPAVFNEGLQRTAYIPAEYKPLALSTALSTVRDAIIPPTGSAQNDVDTVNIVMRILHSSDLEPYVLRPDSRITYTLETESPATLANGQVSLKMSKSSDCDVVPQYRFVTRNPIIPGAGRYTWTISSVDANRVRVRNTKGMTEVMTLNPRSASTTSLPVNIIPGYISAYFDLPTKAFTGTFKAEYVLDVRATYDVQARFDALSATFITKNGIFDIANDPDVTPVLYDIWLYNPSYVARYGAGVLAYIYALEHLRK